ncbi:MAG: hypothetical protein JWL98_2065 [Xanthomonadaceae bacterium]|nr:hypothetical protein [Xanthomonadaceae bacterium]
MPITSHVRWLIGLLLVLLVGTAAAAPVLATIEPSAPRIGVMTMQPGEVFWERFGHDAIIVDDPARGEPVSYNFGFFDPSEPDFIARFIRGRMRYQLVALPLSQDLAYYRDVGRGVSVQWLDLTPAQRADLGATLAVNALPRNARYDYDYFTDNCATRVRDAVYRALGGRLKEQLSARSRGNSYRSEAVRLASPAPWMWLGFDVGLGPFADVPLARWQEAFVPMRLADSLREATASDGRPLVASEEQLLPHRLKPEPADYLRPWWPWLLWGAGIAIALLWLGRRAPRLLAAMAFTVWTLSGLLGGLLLFIWFGTAHRAGWANQNLLLFNPLSLLLLPGGWRMARGRSAGRWMETLLTIVMVCAVVAWIMRWLPFPFQDNTHWIALMLPLHLALFTALRRR